MRDMVQVFAAGSIDFSSTDPLGEFDRFFEVYKEAPGIDRKIDLLIQISGEARETVARAYCFQCIAYSMLFTLMKDRCHARVTLADLITGKELTYDSFKEHKKILQFFKDNVGRNKGVAYKSIKVGDLLLQWIDHPDYGKSFKRFDAIHMTPQNYKAIANMKGVDDRLDLLDRMVNNDPIAKKMIGKYNGKGAESLTDEERAIKLDDRKDELKNVVRKVNNFIQQRLLIFCDNDGMEWTGGEIKIYKGV